MKEAHDFSVLFHFCGMENFINLSFVSEATNPTMPRHPRYRARSISVVEYSALICLGSLLEKPIRVIPEE